MERFSAAGCAWFPHFPICTRNLLVQQPGGGGGGAAGEHAKPLGAERGIDVHAKHVGGSGEAGGGGDLAGGWFGMQLARGGGGAGIGVHARTLTRDVTNQPRHSQVLHTMAQGTTLSKARPHP